MVEDIRSRFTYPAYEKLPHMPDELQEGRARSAVRAPGARTRSSPHKVPGYAIVTLSLKPVGGPPGDATADQMDALADLADKYSLRRNPRRPRAESGAAACRAARPAGAVDGARQASALATPNVNLVTDIIACPGLDYCSLANARSIPIAQELTRRFANHDTRRI